MPKILSDRDAARLQSMLRWFDSYTDTRYQRRRHHGSGGGGGSSGRVAYCKTDAPNSSDITCYLDADVLLWDEDTVYGLDDWCEVASVEYKSLLADNEGNDVSDGLWWEAGTKSVTVTCNISNGSALDEAMPYLTDGDPISVEQVSGTWRCSAHFNGAVVRA